MAGQQLPTTRFRRNDQIVDVLEGAAVLNHTGEFPPGVTQAEGGGLLFQGVPILDGSYLVYDELGTPRELWAHDDFKETYAADFEGAKGTTELKGELAQAVAMGKKLEEQVLDLDATVDQLRNLARDVANALGLSIANYDDEAAFVAAVQAKAKVIASDVGPAAGERTDTAKGVLRDILRIEPAQVRDDGGRIIHLNKKIIDRVVALV